MKLVIQKGNYKLKIRCESDLLPASKERVSCRILDNPIYLSVHSELAHMASSERSHIMY